MSELISTIPVVLAFVLAGLLWSGSGIVQGYRKHVAFVAANPKGTVDPNWSGIDRQAVKDDVILGTGLGLVAFFVNAYNGSVTVDISTLKAFTTVVVGAFGVVALVDKWVIAGIFGK